jgi:hypothetical protein
VGSDALPHNIPFSRSGVARTTNSKTTYLHCRGSQLALDHFEHSLRNALESAAQLVNRYDGLITYQQSLGTHQQDETVRKLIGNIAPVSNFNTQATPSNFQEFSPSADRPRALTSMGRRVNIMDTPMTIVGETPSSAPMIDVESEFQ